MFDALRAAWNRRKAWLCALLALALPLAVFPVGTSYADGTRTAANTSSASPIQSRATALQTAASSNEYSLIDSGIRVDALGTPYRQAYWVSNDSVLFVGVDYSNTITSTGLKEVTYSLMVWNFKTREIKTIRTFEKYRPGLCFDEGVVLYYSKKDDGTFEAYQGRLGSEQPVDLSNKFNYLFCRPLAEAPGAPAWTKDHQIRWLEKLGAGFLDFGPTKGTFNNTRIRLYKPGAKNSEGLELPFGRRDVAPRFPYFRFANAFFVESSYYLHPRPKSIPYPLYWLYEDGRIEKIAEIPWGPWRSRASFFVSPARPGVLMVSNNARSPSQIDHAGVYLLRDGHVKKLVTGWVLGIKVSPDGCSAALSYWPQMTLKYSSLKVLRLCERP
jgi:hypothetical protein